MDQCYDIGRIEHVHFIPFWSVNQNIISPHPFIFFLFPFSSLSCGYEERPRLAVALAVPAAAARPAYSATSSSAGAPPPCDRTASSLRPPPLAQLVSSRGSGGVVSSAGAPPPAARPAAIWPVFLLPVARPAAAVPALLLLAARLAPSGTLSPSSSLQRQRCGQL